jgi:acyl-CoA thioesterase FadM
MSKQPDYCKLLPAELERGMFVEVRADGLDAWVPCQIQELDDKQMKFFVMLDDERAFAMTATLDGACVKSPQGKILEVRPMVISDSQKEKLKTHLKGHFKVQ